MSQSTQSMDERELCGDVADALGRDGLLSPLGEVLQLGIAQALKRLARLTHLRINQVNKNLHDKKGDG